MPLSLSDLDKYPDLKKRFMDLRPVDLTLAVDVTLYEPSGAGENSDFPLEAPHYYEYSDFATATKYVKRSPHLMIVEEGETGTDFVPSSPQNWSDFLTWTGGSILSGDDPNAKARNTLRRTQSIIFGTPRIEKIALPESQMRAIYQEYRQREEEGEKKEAAEDKLAEKMREIEQEKARKEAEAKLARKMAEQARSSRTQDRSPLPEPVTKQEARAAVTRLIPAGKYDEGSTVTTINEDGSFRSSSGNYGYVQFNRGNFCFENQDDDILCYKVAKDPSSDTYELTGFGATQGRNYTYRKVGN